MSGYDSKMVIVMRADLNMRKGKMIAQGAHAAMMFLARDLETIPLTSVEKNWLWGSMAKICVRVDSDEELEMIGRAAEEAGLAINHCTDAGYTEFHGVPTRTCAAIGPNKVDAIDRITGHLKLL